MSDTIKQMISADEIDKRLREIAQEVKEEFVGEELILVGVLKGAIVLMTDLARKLDLDVEFDFIEVSSYGNATETSGVIKINKDLKHSITGKNVLLIEDIIDTGLTLNSLRNHLLAQNPAKLKICVLLDKPDRREVEGIVPDYTGFTIPDKFVVGYGLDYAQKYRHLPYIGEVILNS